MFFTPLEQFNNFNSYCFFLVSHTNIILTFIFVQLLVFFTVWINNINVTQLSINSSRFINLFKYTIISINAFVTSLIKDNIIVNNQTTFVFIKLTFYTILLSNLLGLLPFSDTVTATLYIPFFLSLSGFFMVNIWLYTVQFEDILNYFVPSSTPALLKPFITWIELLSHTVKCISLSVRLFANMFAGHVLLYILGSTNYVMLTTPGLIFLALSFPLLVFLIIQVMEIFVCFLQAYVFITLLNMYFGDVVTAH